MKDIPTEDVLVFLYYIHLHSEKKMLFYNFAVWQN